MNILARQKGFQKLTGVEDALKIFFDASIIKRPEKVSVELGSSLDRVSVEKIVAVENLPPFDRSAVDGFALKAEETEGTSQFKPKIFILTSDKRVLSGHAKEIWTGNPIPVGTDAVIMLENTQRIDDKIEVSASLTPHENVSRTGEDLARGEIALEASIRLRPQHIGLLAALGTTKIKVYQRPRVAILTTGNELVAVGSTKKENQTFDSNRLMVESLCHELAADTIDLGIAPDSKNAIASRIEEGLENADMVISTGGTSVGAADLVPESVNDIGKPGVLVHGIAMRPGMPTALAVICGKPVLILSGNPVAAFFGFEIFARPMICRLLGLSNIESRAVVNAKLSKRVNGTLGRRTLVRVRLLRKDGNITVDPLSAKGSGRISTLTKANGFFAIPENREGMEKGENVSVYLIETLRV